MSARDTLVSVVLPTYKRSEYLERAIASVDAQTHGNWQLLVIDDNDPGTTYSEATGRFMQRYAGDSRIRYIRHDRNKGGGAARNTGIKYADGEVVAFLDDDDEWLPQKLERQLEVMMSTGAALVYTGYTSVFPEKGKIRDVIADHGRHDLKSLLAHNTIGTTSTILARRATLFDVGLFDEALASRQDIDLYVRIAEKHSMAAVPEPMAIRNRHAGPAIGKNIAGAIDAHRKFLDKYHLLLQKYPEAHQARLLSLAELMIFTGELDQARSLLREAYQSGPPTLGLIACSVFATRLGHSLLGLGLSTKALLRALRHKGGFGVPLGQIHGVKHAEQLESRIGK